MSDLVIVSGDSAPSVTGTITNPDGTAYDLTGTTVRFQMWRTGDGRLAVDASAVVTSVAGGRVRYDWNAGDTNEPGDYQSRWKITFTGSGAIEHTVPANTISIVAP